MALKCGRGVALEVFSGSGALSKAWWQCRRLAGVPIFELDIANDGSLDLLTRKLQQNVLGWVRAGLVTTVWLGTPCNSWSRAREIPGGPPPLRSGDFPLGLPGLRRADADKVRIGNELARFSAQLFRTCRTLGVPCAIENPHMSRLWNAPFTPQVTPPGSRSAKPIRDTIIDMCQYGTEYRKRTRIRSVHIDFGPAACRCTGRTACSRSGLPHVHLQGKSNGAFLTLRAEAYPRGLCRGLVSCLANARASRLAAGLNSVLNA